MSRLTRSLTPLPDGRYRVRCTETTLAQAKKNGHAHLWPTALVVVADGIAHYFRGKERIWETSSVYPAFHMEATPLPEGMA